RRDLGLDVLEGVGSLMSQSLLRESGGTADEARFAMLDTIREYAIEQLDASGEGDEVRRGHAAYCLVLAEGGDAAVTGAVGGRCVPPASWRASKATTGQPASWSRTACRSTTSAPTRGEASCAGTPWRRPRWMKATMRERSRCSNSVSRRGKGWATGGPSRVRSATWRALRRSAAIARGRGHSTSNRSRSSASWATRPASPGA